MWHRENCVVNVRGMCNWTPLAWWWTRRLITIFLPKPPSFHLLHIPLHLVIFYCNSSHDNPTASFTPTFIMYSYLLFSISNNYLFTSANSSSSLKAFYLPFRERSREDREEVCNLEGKRPGVKCNMQDGNIHTIIKSNQAIGLWIDYQITKLLLLNTVCEGPLFLYGEPDRQNHEFQHMRAHTAWGLLWVWIKEKRQRKRSVTESTCVCACKGEKDRGGLSKGEKVGEKEGEICIRTKKGKRIFD